MPRNWSIRITVRRVTGITDSTGVSRGCGRGGGMRKHSSWAAFLAAAAFLGPIEVVPAATHHDSAAPEASALATGARVADWQLSHLDHFDYIPPTAFRRDTEARRDWIEAAFYIALMQFADAVGQSRYTDTVLAHGEAEGWGFDHRPRHADADATGAVWVWAAQKTRDDSKLVPIRAR